VSFFGCQNDQATSRSSSTPIQDISDDEESIPLITKNVENSNLSSTSYAANVYVFCFYDENQVDKITENICNQKLRACVLEKGTRNCQRINNPTQGDLDRRKILWSFSNIQDSIGEGLVIEVTRPPPSRRPPVSLD